MSWVRLWETEQRREAALLGDDAARVRSVAFAPDDDLLIAPALGVSRRA